MEKNKMGSESDSKEIRLATDIDLQADVEVTVERHLWSKNQRGEDKKRDHLNENGAKKFVNILMDEVINQ